MTMTDDRGHEMRSGPVAIVGQSGGVVTAIKRSLSDRGVGVGYMITSGNQSGLTAADYIFFFVTEPAVKVIICYLEAIPAGEAFLTACRAARAAGKPVIVMKLGGSEAGREAAMAHTGISPAPLTPSTRSPARPVPCAPRRPTTSSKRSSSSSMRACQKAGAWGP